MIKLLSEFGPLIAFFVGYKIGGIQAATLYMIIIGVISALLFYIVNKHIPKFSLISTSILLLSGSITLLTGNPLFIKIKPTILYFIFGSLFLVTALKNRPLLKYMLEATIKLEDKAWNKLSYRFASFFLSMAIVNEFVWRNFDEASWVTFKVFGALPLTILFILSQVPFLMKNRIDQ